MVGTHLTWNIVLNLRREGRFGENQTLSPPLGSRKELIIVFVSDLLNQRVVTPSVHEGLGAFRENTFAFVIVVVGIVVFGNPTVVLVNRPSPSIDPSSLCNSYEINSRRLFL